jgi:hypothetical protein
MAENICNFRQTSSAAEKREDLAGQDNRSSALQLVHQLADVIRSKEDQAADMEARAQTLAQCAVDKLNLAETRLQSAEITRNALEADLRESNAKVEVFEGALKHIEVRVCTMEAQLAGAVLRAKVAETRAVEAEKALELLEEAIRSQLLKTQRPASSPFAAAA